MEHNLFAVQGPGTSPLSSCGPSKEKSGHFPFSVRQNGRFLSLVNQLKNVAWWQGGEAVNHKTEGYIEEIRKLTPDAKVCV